MDKVFNWISILLGSIGGFIITYLGGWDKWLIALLTFMVLDYITGWAKAIALKRLSSAVGFKGIIKKVLILVIVSVGFILQGLMGNALPLRDFIICFYIANEGLSIVENTAEFLPVPEKVKDVLLQIRDKSSVSKAEDSLLELKQEKDNMEG